MSLLVLFGGASGAAPVVGAPGTVALALTAPTVSIAVSTGTATITRTPSMSLYVISTLVRVTATFRDLAGTLANPTTVVCTVRSPAGVTSTPSVTLSSTGIYYADFTPDAAGTWYVEWQGTGTLVVAGDTAVVVRSSYVDAA